MKCKKCGAENQDNAKFCEKCGRQLEKSKTSKISIGLFIGITAVICIAAVLYNTAGKATEEDRQHGNIQEQKKQQIRQTEVSEKIQEEESGQKKNISVTLEINYTKDHQMEYADIIGSDEEGNQIWSYQSDMFICAELEQISEIGIYGENYYFIEGGTVVSLRVEDGTVVWKNGDYKGNGTKFCFYGNIFYLCGYYGPDFFAVDIEGNILNRIENFSPEYYWASDIQYTNDQVIVTMSGSEDGQGGIFAVDPETGSYELLKNDTQGLAEGEKMEVLQNVDMSKIDSISATSALSEYDMTHSPDRAIDGDLTTAWVEGVDGPGEHEAIICRFNDTYQVSGFHINAGYQKNQDIYSKNSRPAQIQVTDDEGRKYLYDLQDLNGVQTIEFTAPLKTNSITIEIISVYYGTKYEDTAISEISFF